MQADINTAARFLAALSGDLEHTFQTYDDNKDRKSKSLNRIVYGSLQRRAHLLESLNLKGAAVSVMVNRGDQAGRKTANVMAGRALFVDLDGPPIEHVMQGPIPPRIVVESSPGKWHAYWPVVDLPLPHFAQAQHLLADRFGGDHSAAALAKVLRVPGFWHNKAAPFQSRLVLAEHNPLTWSEMCEGFGLAMRYRMPSVIRVGERNSTLFRLAAAARRAGVPMAAQLEKARTLNASRCEEPLGDGEVAEVVRNAYSGEDNSLRWQPNALWAAPEFLALSNTQRVMLLAAYARANGYNGGCVALPHSEFSDLFPDEKTFYQNRSKLLESGLLKLDREATKAMPKKGRGPKPKMFQLAIGPFLAPHDPNTPSKPPLLQSAIPPKNHPPEVLHALAPVALDRASEDGGPQRSAA